jgi:hypothetical protein
MSSTIDTNKITNPPKTSDFKITISPVTSKQEITSPEDKRTQHQINKIKNNFSKKIDNALSADYSKTAGFNYSQVEGDL